MSDTQNHQSRAYSSIRHDIIYCDLAPGSKLSVRQLEERLELGRTPVREALLRLSEQGLVYTVPQSGTYVSPINLQSAEDARFAREHLENRITVECCARIDRTGRQTLERIIELQEQAVRQHDARTFFMYDNRFHEALFTIAGRHGLWQIIDAHNTHLERYRWLRTQVQGLEWDRILVQHRQILRAVVERNPEEAQYLSTAHLHLMDAEREAVIKAFPDYFGPSADVQSTFENFDEEHAT